MGSLTLHHFCVLLACFHLFLAVVQASGNISLGSFLEASEESNSWQSPSGEFAFGFRRLDDQNLFLLAIWFDKLPNKTLVWYANGDNPVPEGSKLDLRQDGGLFLSNPQGIVIWSPMAGSGTQRIEYAAMLDSGNFVLASNDSGYVLESFTQPSDTILPTQVLESGGMLSSRQKEGNYSKGRFQLRLLPDGNLVLNTIALPTEYPYEAYYHSHTYDATDSMNSGYRVVFNESGYLYVVRRNGNIVNLTSGNVVPTRDFYHRATLDHDGVFTQYAHPRAPRNGSWDQSWFQVWSVPNDICSDMVGERGGGTCGFNSYCILNSQRRPTCECLPGFSFSDPTNKFNGCKQDIVRKCEPAASNPEDMYDLLALPNIFWPNSASFEQLQPFNEYECSRSCFYDCNCVVAVSNQGSCFKKKLPLSNGRAVDQQINAKAFIKVPRSNMSSGERCFPELGRGRKDQTTLILVGSFLLGGSLLLNFILVPAISILVFRSGHRYHKLTRVSSMLESNLCSFTYEELE